MKENTIFWKRMADWDQGDITYTQRDWVCLCVCYVMHMYSFHSLRMREMHVQSLWRKSLICESLRQRVVYEITSARDVWDYVSAWCMRLRQRVLYVRDYVSACCMWEITSVRGVCYERALIHLFYCHSERDSKNLCKAKCLLVQGCAIRLFVSNTYICIYVCVCVCVYLCCACTCTFQNAPSKTYFAQHKRAHVYTCVCMQVCKYARQDHEATYK